jgi:hypothetical protein
MLPEGPRKPLQAGLTGLPVERRRNRLAPAPCSTCGRDELRVMLRTEYVVYFRCERCLKMWSTPKPDVQQFGT